jgi:hypothetical protein
MSNESTWERWEDGAVSDESALAQLVTDLADLEQECRPALDAHKAYTKLVEQTRERIYRVMQRGNIKAHEANGAVVRLMEPDIRVSYDAAMLNELVADLVQNGELMIADRITAARRRTPVKAHIRVEAGRKG